jgi:hypothetical protein
MFDSDGGTQFFAPDGYNYCTNEGSRCQFDGTMDVAYGNNGQYIYQYAVSGGIDCNNGVFGDPIPNVSKACYTRGVTSVAPPSPAPPPAPSAPSGYTFCASEGQWCSFGGTVDVVYGANGAFASRNGVKRGVKSPQNRDWESPQNRARKVHFFATM